MTTRRAFLAASLAAASLAALPAGAARRARKPVERKPGEPMSILVLGGTGFLGPHFVEAARAKGHKLTLFNPEGFRFKVAKDGAGTKIMLKSVAPASFAQAAHDGADGSADFHLGAHYGMHFRDDFLV